MIGSALPHCEGIKAFSETNQTDDLQAITVPTLVMQGDDDQNVPYKDASPLQAKPLDRLQERRISRVVVQPLQIDNKQDIGGGGGSRTRVRKGYWSRDYMLIRVHALGITQGRSRPTLRTDKKR